MISAEVGGRGFTLDTEDEEELTVRNYRVRLHAVRCDTRKMRRLREMDELGQAVEEGLRLKTPKSMKPKDGRKASSDIGLQLPSRTRSDSGYGTDRPASYDTASDAGSSVSRRAPRTDVGSPASLALPRSEHCQKSSTASSSLSVPQYHQYVQRPGHSSREPSYSSQSQKSDMAVATPRRGHHEHSEGSQYLQTPSVASTSQQYLAIPTQPYVTDAVESRPPRGHYHPLAQNVPNTPQTWSKPQDPSYHQPMPTMALPTRPPPSPHYGSDPGRSLQRRSEATLQVPRQNAYGYYAGGRPRSGSSQSGMSVRTTASEEIKRRAMAQWGD